MEKLHAFHQTRRGYLTFGLAELALLYVFASIATDTANMFAYLAAILLFFGAVINFYRAVKPPVKSRSVAKSAKTAKKVKARHQRA